MKLVFREKNQFGFGDISLQLALSVWIVQGGSRIQMNIQELSQYVVWMKSTLSVEKRWDSEPRKGVPSTLRLGDSKKKPRRKGSLHLWRLRSQGTRRMPKRCRCSWQIRQFTWGLSVGEPSNGSIGSRAHKLISEDWRESGKRKMEIANEDTCSKDFYCKNRLISELERWAQEMF